MGITLMKVASKSSFDNKDELEIKPITMYVSDTIGPRWTGVACSCPGTDQMIFNDFTVKRFGILDEHGAVTDRYFGHIEFKNGWHVIGRFFYNNMGFGFSLARAYRYKNQDLNKPWRCQSDFEHADMVYGCYEDGGLISNDKEALEDFIKNFPPLQCD